MTTRCIFAFLDIEDINEIHIRMSECRNPALNMRNFIPPRFYDRFMALNKTCTEARRNDPNLKTQIWFGSNDLEVLTKEKGSGDPYTNISLQEWLGDISIPEYDHSRKWIPKLDRPPCIRIVYNGPEVDPLETHSSKKHQISRQDSHEEYKKQKKNTSTSGSSSEDSS